MRRRHFGGVGVALLAVLVGAAGVSAPVSVAPMPSALYEEWRISPAPADGAEVAANPPSLLWASVRYWEGRDVRYVVELSDDPAFPAGRTRRSEPQRACFFNPHTKLAPGIWHWRYEIHDAGKIATKGPYSFRVTSGATVFESPAIDEFIARIPKTHPRVVTLGRDLAAIRRTAATHPLAGTVIKQGRAAAKAPVYTGPVEDKGDPARTRALHRKAGQEIKLFHQLIDAHVLAAAPETLAAATERIGILAGWPTDDLLGSQVLTALAKAFDALHAELPADLKARMLAVIDRQIRHGLAAWPGRIEARHVENHFWQMELAGNFTAALATVHELGASREMLAYTYGLFLARFPNLATRDGGWAEGFGYFGVNESAVIDMALLMKRVGGFDVFQLEWYRTLAEYFLHFAPIGGRIDGFGDTHDRVGSGDTGQAMMFVLGQETGDPLALYRAARLEERSGEAVEPWYRIVGDLRFDPSRVPAPAAVPQARLFSGVGLAAFHTDVLESGRDTAVYFRSSPFGAKGHMHANQNAFNLSRRGEPLFYSTGYYTTFADAHSLTSYRHTRAHNAILVNGIGQAFGHEGYGWIKRYAHGRDFSYVCGDASMAYRPTVDKQFLCLLAEAKIPHTPEFGHGDAGLRRFERHLLLVRPDTVVIYDVLEAETPSEWSLLLHTMQPPVLAADGKVELDTAKNRARVQVLGSGPLAAALTDRFFRPPVDTLKKYRETPDQHHIAFASEAPTRGMRFLTVLQLGDAGAGLAPVRSSGAGRLTVGGVAITAELDPAKPAALAVATEAAALFVNAWPVESHGAALPPVDAAATLLVERHGATPAVTVAGNRAPTF